MTGVQTCALPILSGARGTSQLTVSTVHEPVMVQNPDAPEFDYYVNAEVIGQVSVRLDEGEKTSLKAADGSVYIIEVDKDRNVTVSVSGSLDGAIDETEAPKVTVDGMKQTDGMDFAKSVTLARQDSTAKNVQVKINTLDNLNSSEIQNDAKDVPKGPDVPYVPTPSSPAIRTTAIDSETNDHISEADQSVTIVDTVNYWNLTAGKEYVLKGVLMDQATGEPLRIDGKMVTSEVKFKPTTANGSMDVTFTFDGSSLGGKSLVVFEELYLLTDMDHDGTPEKEIKAAEHKDITDEGQTVLLKAPEEEPEEEPKTKEPEEEPQHEPTPEKPMEVPKTGDSTPLGLWILLLVGTAVMTVTFYRRRG